MFFSKLYKEGKELIQELEFRAIENEFETRYGKAIREYFLHQQKNNLTDDQIRKEKNKTIE